VRRAPNQPVTTALTIFAGIYAKAYTVPDAGTLLPQHSHKTGHVTAITAGSVRAWRDGELLGDFCAPALVLIPAHAMHSFLTLSDQVSLICIHNADHLEADEPAVAEEHHLDFEEN
jgi:hypothetical protein